MSDDGRADAELLAAAARGGEADFGVLVRRYIRSATFLAAQLLGDADDAQDVVQDAFAVVYRNALEFDPERPFGPWLYGMIRRLAANRRARDARRARLLKVFARESQMVAPATDRIVTAQLDAERAGRMLEQLSPMQRACFELVAIRGLPVDEVAAMHDISESTVRQHVFRARASLKQALEKER